jgi:hypothetical protein
VSFEAFHRAIESQALREVAEHWNMARGAKAMPGWQDIRPAAIRSHLPIIWSWKFDNETQSFVGRLAGQRIESTFQHSFRGAAMRDLFPAHDYDRILARHRRVMEAPALFIGKGLVFRHLDRFDVGERIIMPLSDSGAAGDGIFGATLSQPVTGPRADDFVRQGETETWFAL